VLDDAGRQQALCARVVITYVCVDIVGRKTAPIPAGLRQALVADQA
jgi:acyl-CoA thioesterase FadM